MIKEMNLRGTQIRKLLAIILMAALLVTYVFPVQGVFALDDDGEGQPAATESAGGEEPPADPEPPADLTVDPPAVLSVVTAMAGLGEIDFSNIGPAPGGTVDVYYTVSFIAEGVGQVDSLKVKAGDGFEIPEISSIPMGDEFLGWSRSTEILVPYDNEPVMDDFSLYAFYGPWAAPPEEDGVVVIALAAEPIFTVTYAPGEKGTFAPKVTGNLSFGDPTPTAPAVTGQTGWTFAGWAPAPTSIVTGDATYYACWSQIVGGKFDATLTIHGDNYTIIIHGVGQGSNKVFTVRVIYDGVDLGNQDFTVVESGTGATTISFMGYTITVNLHGNDMVDALQSILDRFTVSYLANGGLFASGLSYDNYMGLTRDDNMKTAEVPTREGYVFDGWLCANDGQIYMNAAAIIAKYPKVPGNMTFTAQWKEVVIETYTVRYLPGDHGTFAIQTTPDLEFGDPTPTAPAATGDLGYKFTGWSPAPTPTVQGDADYVAQWEIDPDQTYTINYISNGNGSVDPASETHQVLFAGPNTGSTAAPAFGYKFKNWTSDAAGLNEVSTSANYVPTILANATFYANFEIDPDQTYTITYESSGNGTVSPGSETHQVLFADPNTGSTATAAPGYKFKNWTDKDGVEVSVNATFIPTDRVDVTYTANFEEDADITINYEANPGGTVSLASETLAPATGVAQGSTAAAAAGYYFVSWTDESGAIVSFGEEFVPDKNADGIYEAATYYANFAQYPDVTIYYVADPAAGGTVSLGSETLPPATGVAQGSTASAAAGYSFVNWTNEAGEEVGTGLTFVPEKVGGLNVAATYTANFVENSPITINYEATTGGSVSPASETLAPATGVAQGSTATAAPGYHFVNWTNAAGEEVGTAVLFVPEKVDGLNVAATYTANFAEDADITINYEAATGGSVSLASETLPPATGEAQGSTASAAAGYSFVNWTNEAGDVVGTDLTFVPEKVDGLNVAATYTANFVEDAAITINYEATTGGSVSLASETLAPATGVAQGSTASAAAGYHFVNWTNAAGEEVGTAVLFVPEKVDGLNVAATYTANFAEDADITINYEATTGGSVSLASETLPPATGEAQGSTASAAAGYSFVNWTNAAGDVVGTDLTFVPEKVGGLNVAATYTANFVEDADITINYEATTGGSVSLASETLPPATGEAQGSTASAAAGYHFVNWTNEAGDVVGTELLFVPEKVDGLNVAATYTANFVEDADITINYEAATGGTVSLASETLPPATGVAQGSTATAAAGYDFANWTNEAGAVVSTALTFVPEKVGGLNVAATYTANFTQWPNVTINYVADPAAGGTVSLDTETLPPATGVAQGSTASAAAGYSFVNWTNAAGDVVGTGLTFVPDKVGGLNVAATYTANFVENPPITINYEATTGGSVSPASETLAPATGVAQGSTATAAPGYHFVNWTNAAGEEVGTAVLFVPEKVGGLNVAATYTANFEENPEIMIEYVANTGGSVDNDSDFIKPVTGTPEGSTATAADGWIFVNWTDGQNNVVGTEEFFLPQRNADEIYEAATYYANFAIDPELEIVIRANSLTVTYDSASHSASGFTVDDFGTLNAMGFTVTAVTTNPSAVNVVESPASDPQINAVTSFTIKYNGVDVTDMFDENQVTTYDGELIINPATITITTYSATKVFDGAALRNLRYTVAGTVFEPDALSVTVTGSRTAVGRSNNTLVWAITRPVQEVELMADDEIFNPASNYTVRTTLGMLTVNPTTPPGTPPGDTPGTPPGTPPGDTPGTPIEIVPGTTIMDAPVPQAAPETVIEPVKPPLASFASWALLNLILTIITGLIMVALLVTYFIKRKDDEEEADKEDEKENVKKRLGLRLITIAATVIAIVLFILTQDMTLPMGFIDTWTIWHIVITAAAVVLAFFSKKKYEDEEEAAETL